MPRRQLQDATEGRDRFGHILFRLCEPQREIAIRIVGRRGHERARPGHRFGSFSRLDQGENQVVGSLPGSRALGDREPVRVDGGIERAQPFERLSQEVLDLGIMRGEPCRLPQQ